MTRPVRKQCTVAYATSEQQYLWSVDLPWEANIADALEAARTIASSAQVPWESAAVGIFGERRQRSEIPAPGDRIELYRPLRCDPRQRRREQVQKQRKGTPR
ncbi:MAG TPA: RnfH family protein [Steroidobacteraceae bacterium]|nr:RnfH family protein [Steroidobacteraceae bacterium]